MKDEVIVKVENLWKQYGLPMPNIIKRLRQGLKGENSPLDHWALKDISFEVKKGETIGIIGLNGAGKSTLLKILAGVTPATRGKATVKGRIFPMIELNAGIHPELTGRENVRLLGAIMGFSRQEIEIKIPEIEEFTELGEWFGRPVRMYSSGMLAKLGFAVAMCVDAEVLLIDEVLSVGDFAFQKKCVTRVAEMSNKGATTIFVSHNPYMIERMCDKVAWIQQGSLQALGDPGNIIPKYFEMSAGQKPISTNDKGLTAHLRPGTGDLRIKKIEVLDSAGQPTTEIYTGDSVTFRLHYKTTEVIREPNFGIRIFDPQNTMVVSLASTAVKKSLNFCGEGYLDCKIQKLFLMHNIYTVQVKVAGDILLDMYENAAQFIVKSDAKVLVDSGNMGMVYADADWSYSLSAKTS